MSYNERLQNIIQRYREADQPWPGTTKSIAAWAIANGLWQAQSATLINQCAVQLAKAMREEYFTDTQGRRVRAKHVVMFDGDGEQIPIWEDIRDASREHMELSFQQRRQRIVGDCRQLKTDVDSFNDNANRDEPVNLVFDFSVDVAELELVRSPRRPSITSSGDSSHAQAAAPRLS
jgi:hypothetical protein